LRLTNQALAGGGEQHPARRALEQLELQLLFKALICALNAGWLTCSLSRPRA
jgi:hypothetical protein